MELWKGIVLADPSEIKPNYSYFPFMSKLNAIAGGVAGVSITVLVILFIVAGVSIFAGKMGMANQMSQKSWGILVGAMVVAAIIGSAGGIIYWASLQQLA
ncbi:hypothetical protein ACFQY8_07700 [Alloscardovia venturai]|uniref:Yip1 domain-containing protein n=1 Tax=Alloscardovia venturai TaxID=1769421 RepID=A0ABW2Y5Z2_9BIFI